MPEPPRLSSRELFECLQVFGFLIVLVEILRAANPLSYKVAVVGIPVVAIYTILVFRYGRRRERERIRETLAQRRRERGEVSAGGGERGERRRRDAA